MKYKIYYLSSSAAPEEVRYVGKTIQLLRQRLSNHKQGNNGRYTHHWVQSEISAGNKILINLIEEFDTVRDDREIYWIAHYRALGAKLTNIHDGGDIISEEQRKECAKRGVETKRRNRKDKNFKKVYELDEDGNVINEFLNGYHCSEVTGLRVTQVYQTLIRDYRARIKGRILTYDPSVKKREPVGHGNTREVSADILETGERRTYTSITNAAADLNVRRGAIYDAVKNGRILFGKYIFYYERKPHRSHSPNSIRWGKSKNISK